LQIPEVVKSLVSMYFNCMEWYNQRTDAQEISLVPLSLVSPQRRDYVSLQEFHKTKIAWSK